jgi:hypothetical protein|tara:strand:- start:98 stop:610 length:513 start_codon:yes stop_codon:yes gene_type:complete
MFRKDIGKEFKKQMNNWFTEHPEIKHQWKESELKIHYPTKINKFLTFEFNSKKIKIQNDNTEKIFHRELFTNIGEQVIKIRSFWINELLNKDETEIKKPDLKENQIAIMFCNRKYGQILTTEKNVFTGWGNVYQIFENKKEAKKFIEIESKNEEIEINVFNSKYENIELK